MSINKDNGLKLKGFRLQNELSVNDLSKLIGKSPRQIFRYEAGEAPIPEDILSQLNSKYKLGLKSQKKTVKVKLGNVKIDKESYHINVLTAKIEDMEHNIKEIKKIVEGLKNEITI